MEHVGWVLSIVFGLGMVFAAFALLLMLLVRVVGRIRLGFLRAWVLSVAVYVPAMAVNWGVYWITGSGVAAVLISYALAFGAGVYLYGNCIRRSGQSNDAQGRRMGYPRAVAVLLIEWAVFTFVLPQIAGHVSGG